MEHRGASVALRVVMAVFTNAFFQPDEFFQSLEVAHRAVFGFGHLTWEWLADVPVRSAVFPMLYSPVYWILKVTKLDSTPLLILLPRVLTGLFASITDIAVYDLSVTVLGPQYADTALFLSWTSFFHSLSLVRSMSNSLETSLTTLALNHWLKYSENATDAVRTAAPRVKTEPLVNALFYAGLATMIRPTNIIMWAFLLMALLWRIRSSYSVAVHTLVISIWFANLFAGVLFCVDSVYFAKPTISPWNFFVTNLSSVSVFYGSNSWHYYLSQAFPILCTTSLPFVLHGTYSSLRTSSKHQHAHTLSMLVLWTTAVFSTAKHKEWRFLHPLLPILHIFAAKSLVDVYLRSNKASRALPIRSSHRAFLLLSVPVSLYVIFFHGRAQINVMRHLHGRNDIRSIGFLTPCHSTPWQSHLHRRDLEGHIWALGCEPPLRGENLTTYRDQTRVFFDAPALYLRQRFPRRVDSLFPRAPSAITPPGKAPIEWHHTWPSHLVLFGALLDEKDVRSILEEKGYRPLLQFGNGWEEDEKRRGGMHLWKWEESEFQKRFAST